MKLIVVKFLKYLVSYFSIDPGYRGVAGEVSTQYSNLHKNPDEKFLFQIMFISLVQ